MKIEKITRKQWAVALLILSIPLVWWGYVNFMYKGSNSAVMAMAISLCLTSGICCVVGGIYMLFTKEKDRGDGLLASQTKVKDPPINIDFGGNIINKPTKKVNEMETSVEMMKREKELETRRKELEGLLEEVRQEENELEQSLQTKGWVKKDGEWKIP